jgi:hypothetical protein
MLKKLFLSVALIGLAHASAFAIASHESEDTLDIEASLEDTTLSPTDLAELKKKLLQELLSQEKTSPQTSHTPVDPKSVTTIQMAGGARGGEGGHAIESSGSRQITAAKVTPTSPATYTSSKAAKALEEQRPTHTRKDRQPASFELNLDQNAPENPRTLGATHSLSQKQRVEHQAEYNPEVVLESVRIANNKTLQAISEAPSVSVEEPHISSFHAGSGETLSSNQPEMIEAIQLLSEQDLLKQTLTESLKKRYQTRFQKREQRKKQKGINKIDQRVKEIMTQMELKGKKRKLKNQSVAPVDQTNLNDLFVIRHE